MLLGTLHHLEVSMVSRLVQRGPARAGSLVRVCSVTEQQSHQASVTIGSGHVQGTHVNLVSGVNTHLSRLTGGKCQYYEVMKYNSDATLSIDSTLVKFPCSQDTSRLCRLWTMFWSCHNIFIATFNIFMDQLMFKCYCGLYVICSKESPMVTTISLTELMKQLTKNNMQRKNEWLMIKTSCT